MPILLVVECETNPINSTTFLLKVQGDNSNHLKVIYKRSVHGLFEHYIKLLLILMFTIFTTADNLSWKIIDQQIFIYFVHILDLSSSVSLQQSYDK